jgi:hypothetical protein
MRRQMLDGFGGWTGMALTAIPTLVFVAVNTLSTLRVAVAAAVGSALLLTVYRLIRRQPIQQALNGLVGVVIAAAIAARTGQARGYFLIGIWSSFLYGAVFLGSMVARRPLVGLVWEFLDPTPIAVVPPSPAAEPAAEPVLERAPVVAWYRRPHLARAYYLATLAATVVFLARGVVQFSLFQSNSTGWLAVARIAMGYPLTIGAAGLAWWMVRRARRRLTHHGL